MNQMGAKIVFYRKAQGMTQEELAEKCGVTAQAVSKWENDITCPDIQLLGPLSKIFNITTDELLSAEPVKAVRLVPENERSSLKELTLKVIVDSKAGDKVRINLPMELVRVALEIGTRMPQLSDHEYLKNIDFGQVLALVESGVIGKLVEVESADGEIVQIVVE